MGACFFSLLMKDNKPVETPECLRLVNQDKGEQVFSRFYLYCYIGVDYIFNETDIHGIVILSMVLTRVETNLRNASSIASGLEVDKPP